MALNSSHGPLLHRFLATRSNLAARISHTRLCTFAPVFLTPASTLSARMRSYSRNYDTCLFTLRTVFLHSPHGFFQVVRIYSTYLTDQASPHSSHRLSLLSTRIVPIRHTKFPHTPHVLTAAVHNDQPSLAQVLTVLKTIPHGQRHSNWAPI